MLSLAELPADLESIESKARHGSDRKAGNARPGRVSIGESPESVRPSGASFKSNKSNNNSFRSNNNSFLSTDVSSFKKVSSYKDELSPELRDAGRCKSTAPPTTAAMPNFALRRRMSLNATGFGQIDRPTSPPALPDA